MNEIYSITKQYHKKNCVDIWVVRLGIKVDKKMFGILKRFAQDHGGYYSSYKGVNGFVFKQEVDATDFGNELYDLVMSEYEPDEDEDNDEGEIENENEITEQPEILVENVEIDNSAPDEVVANINEAFTNQLPSVKLDSKPQTLPTLRPSIHASEEVWDYYLSNRIIWKVNPLAYEIEAKASVATNKSCKVVEVFVELNNCQSQNIELYTTLYDVNGLIKNTSQVAYGGSVTGFKICHSYSILKCSITKIDKIIISGKITESYDK